jgi:hypothetical protein
MKPLPIAAGWKDGMQVTVADLAPTAMIAYVIGSVYLLLAGGGGSLLCLGGIGTFVGCVGGIQLGLRDRERSHTMPPTTRQYAQGVVRYVPMASAG